MSTTNETVASTQDTEEAVRDNLVGFLEGHVKNTVAPDLDLFDSGLVSSLFAMQLVVHLEGTFGVTVGGPDLKLDNFRTVNAMTALVGRLRADAGE